MKTPQKTARTFSRCERCGFDINLINLKKHVSVCDGRGPHYKRKRLYKNGKQKYTNGIEEKIGEMQAYYNDGHTFTETCKFFNMSFSTLSKLVKLGKFISRSTAATRILRGTHNKGKQTHTTESRKKISEARKKFLTENPDKVPYLLNHSSNFSYPELLFKTELERQGITGWVSKFRFGMYEFDFAFPQLKIDIEIDGSTHLLEKVRLKDQRRDKLSTDQGWKVVRFTAKQIKNELDLVIEKVKKLITQ